MVYLRHGFYKTWVAPLIISFTSYPIRMQVCINRPYLLHTSSFLLQVVLEQRGRGNVEVGTVDQYQGRDKLVVIYACTRSNGGGKEVRAGNILNDTRRLNVAITRARAKLIILGDRNTLIRDYEPFRKIDNFFKGEKSIVKIGKMEPSELQFRL